MSFRSVKSPLGRSVSATPFKNPPIQNLVSAWFSKSGNGQKSRRVSRGDQKRAEVLWSILASETKYGRQLSQIYKSFYRPIKASHLLSESQLKILFLNTELLLNLHTEFKEEIVKTVRDWSLIQELGPPFQLLAKHLDLYREYAEKYSDMLQLMQLQLANADFQRLLKKKLTSGKDLRNLLQAPLQLIPRYALYIQEYLAYTHRKHLDYNDLPGILTQFEEVSELLQNAQRANHDADKIMFIVSQVKDARLSLFGSESKYLSEAEMHIVHSENNREVVYGYLFDDLIFLTSEDAKMTRTMSMRWTKVFTQNGRSSKSRYRFHSTYRIMDILEVCEMGPATFTLVLSGHSVTFQMESAEKRIEWLTYLKSLTTSPCRGRSMTL